MTRQVKLAILRARHDPDVPVIDDQACLQMLMTSQSRRSVLNYWTDTTDGYLLFDGSEMFPWVNISLAATETSRSIQISKAHAATGLLENADLSRFDGFIVMTLPGFIMVPNPEAGKPDQPPTVRLNLDGGSTVFASKNACALPVMTSDHTFMCHEVGHVLGFKHTYGVWNNGIDWDGKLPADQGQVYGDPYDIMSSATFGRRDLDPTLITYVGNPTFAGPAVAGWPFPGAVQMGPAPARAHVHVWDPSAVPAHRVRHLPTPASGSVQSARLFAAGAARLSTELVVIHPVSEGDQGRGRCYVEYRSLTGWDSGLDVSGTDLARQAVVVHTIESSGSSGDPGVRCWYRGRILVPLETDTDLAVEGTWLVIRVTGVAADERSVDIEISTSSIRGIDLVTRRRTEVTSAEDSRMERTRCGDELEWATWIERSIHSYVPHTHGYGGSGAPGVTTPLISWTVGGIVLSGVAGNAGVATSDGAFTVDYTIDPISGELTLTSRPGEKYTTPVVATATESDGSDPTTVTEHFNPEGSFTGFQPGDLMRFDRCLSTYLLQVGIRARDFLLQPEPDPRLGRIRELINEGRLREVIRRVAVTRPVTALALNALLQLRYRDGQ